MASRRLATREAKRRVAASSLASPARILYRTALGQAIAARAEEWLPTVAEGSIDLLVTSPPFPLLREKAYGNPDQAAYVDWLVSFGPGIRRVLADTGSLVLDLGGAYQRGVPVRSLHSYRVLLRLCDEHGFHLAEEFFWHNTAKLPSPIEWVNKRKVRVKDSVNTVWWLSKTPHPKADARNVLVPYSERMRKLLREPEAFASRFVRPSGHDVNFRATENEGAIPANLLCCPNTESNSLYLRLCKRFGVRPHPARFPEALPEFFVRFLTQSGDTVLDLFAGSNATGAAAERLGRRWLAVDVDPEYVSVSAFRFMEGWDDDAVAKYLATIRTAADLPIDIGMRRSAAPAT
jgi:site-specific DNA-methyltransferase (cytosine-N4-specific)